MSASMLPTDGSAVVLNADGRIVCERCAIADTVLGRLRGLLGRDRLLQGEGLWVSDRAGNFSAWRRVRSS